MGVIRPDGKGGFEEVSWQHVFEEEGERRQAILKGDITWGPWRFNPTNLCLESDAEHGEYQVDLERCRTSAEMLDWIIQVCEKSWADDATVAGLVRALDDLLLPQATLCSMGVERGPLDVTQFLASAGD